MKVRTDMKRSQIDRIRRYGRRTILETVRSTDKDSDVRYQIVQYTLPVFHGSDALSIEFDNNGAYIYSAVYTSSRRHFQPVYQLSQRIIDAYFGKDQLKNALVLGCAGCTIPRFLTLHYKASRVTGIEYSQQFVDIAKRYFFNDEMRSRFELIRQDGFAYVEQALEKQRYDLVYTDIYVADYIHPKVYTQQFVQQLYDIITSGGLAVINSFRVPFERIKEFVGSIKAPFGALYIIEQYRKHYIALMKTSDAETLKRFEKKLPRYAVIDLKIVR